MTQMPGAGNSGGNSAGRGPDGLSPMKVEQPPQRRASVQFERAGGVVAQDALDPANQSLSEALGLVSKILNIAMLALAGVFLLSGLTSVKENETGVRLLFGRVIGSDLRSGFQFSWPYPLGEVVKIDTGLQSLSIDEQFWPKLSDPSQKPMQVQQLVAFLSRNLTPADGMNITGDENLAHTKWRATYTRSKPIEFAKNILSEADRATETAIVRSAVQRGVVHAIASIKIDDLLKQSSGEGQQGTLSVRARQIAQDFLDSIGSGIEINKLDLVERIPPFLVYNDFSGVQSAEQKAAQKRADAEAQAQTRLNVAAGEAAPILVKLIQRYELAIEAQKADEAATILESIYAVMDGRSVTIDGVEVKPRVSGNVVVLLNDAREYASSIVSRRKAELAAFESKLVQFKTNPSLVINREWADAMGDFLGRKNTEIVSLPPGVRWYRLLLNRDPSIVREIEKLAKEARTKEAEERRNREIEQAQYKTNIETPLRGR